MFASYVIQSPLTKFLSKGATPAKRLECIDEKENTPVTSECLSLRARTHKCTHAYAHTHTRARTHKKEHYLQHDLHLILLDEDLIMNLQMSCG